jgi:hypothetical protein
VPSGRDLIRPANATRKLRFYQVPAAWADAGCGR